MTHHPHFAHLLEIAIREDSCGNLIIDFEDGSEPLFIQRDFDQDSTWEFITPCDEDIEAGSTAEDLREDVSHDWTVTGFICDDFHPDSF